MPLDVRLVDFTLKDVRLVDFTLLTFTHIPGDGYRRRFRSFRCVPCYIYATSVECCYFDLLLDL